MAIQNVQIIKNNNPEEIITADMCDVFNDGSSVAVYPFDGNASDLCGKYSGTWSGTEAYDEGKFGLAAKFDGNGYVTTTLNNPFKNDFTFTCWFKGFNIPDDGTDVAFAADDSDFKFALSFRDYNYGVELRWLIGNSSEWLTSFGPNKTGILSDGEWHFIAVLKSGKTYKFYIDNKEVYSYTSSYEDYQGDGNVRFGIWGNNKYYDTNHLIDQVRIFNRALTDDEIQKLYNEQAAQVNIISTINTCDIFNDGSSVATYPLDGNANDLCGKYNGTWVGNEQYDTGKFGQAAKFDGSSFIESTIDLNNYDAVTFSFWLSDNSTDNQKFIGFSGSNDMAIQTTDGTTCKVYVRSNSNPQEVSNFFINDGSWHHYAFILDSNGCKHYRDGKYVTTTPQIWSEVTTDFNIGKVTDNDGSTDYTKGLIDQVRIFNRALSDDEIQTLYSEQVIQKDSMPVVVKEVFDSTLNEYTFEGDNQKYMVGNGNVTLNFDKTANEVSFVIGSFASVDLDSGEDSSSDDYVKIETSKGTIELELSSLAHDSAEKIVNNETPYQVLIEKLGEYQNEVLDGQDSSYGTVIRKITISNMEEESITINMHTNEDISNEAFGYQVGSAQAKYFTVLTSEMLKQIINYRFAKIDNAFSQYGNVKVQVKFTAANSGVLLATANFENIEEEYLIHTLLDFTNKKINVTSPGVFTDYLINDYQSYDLPSLTENTDYTLELTYQLESLTIRILDQSNKEIFNKDCQIGLLSYIGDEKLKETSFKFGINVYSIDEIIMYYNFKENLEEDFLYAGNKILDEDYLGVVSLDNSTEILTRNNYIRNALSVDPSSTASFIQQDSNYRYVLAKKVTPTNTSTLTDTILDISIDPTSLLDENGQYVFKQFYILIPFKFIEDDKYSSSKYFTPFLKINSNSSINVPYSPKEFSGYVAVLFNLLDKNITCLYLNLDKTFSVPKLNLEWKEIKSFGLIENEKNIVQFGYIGSSNDLTFYLRSIYLFKNYPNKYLVKSTFNMNLPMIDLNTYNIPSQILSLQV